MAAKLPVSALTRAWQMLLKGLLEVRDAAKPLAACEMALIRLAYAADLPPTDKLVRDVMNNPPLEGGGSASVPGKPLASAMNPSPKMTSSFSTLPQGEGVATASKIEAHPTLRTLEDIAALAQAHGAPVLRVNVENDIHLVRLEPGQLEFRPSARAPKTLAGDLAQKLKQWTGTRWVVTVAREGGAPTLAEKKKMAAQAKLESVMQEPMVRAVLDRFPGAEIVAVRDTVEDEIAAAPEEEAE
jgi:DNA polymerase-3 subunit gamma/tau